MAPKCEVMEDINRHYCLSKDIWQPGNMSDKGNKEEEEKVRALCTLQFEQHSRYTARRVKITSSSTIYCFKSVPIYTIECKREIYIPRIPLDFSSNDCWKNSPVLQTASPLEDRDYKPNKVGLL